MALVPPPTTAEDYDRLYARFKQAYDLYRDLLLNRKYYGLQLERTRAHHRVAQIVLTLGTSSTLAGLVTTAAGWTWGPTLWGGVTLAVAVLGIVWPLLGYAQRLERYSKLYTEYTLLFYQMEQTVNALEAEGGFTPTLVEAVQQMERRSAELAGDDDPQPDNTLILTCQNAVEREIPVSRLWLPPPPSVWRRAG